MVAIAEANSLFEIDAELDSLLDVIEEQVASDGQPSEDLVARFYQFCDAHGEKVDRIGRFLRMEEVIGSIPIRSTNNPLQIRHMPEGVRFLLPMTLCHFVSRTLNACADR